jgi:tetratricopeptide (TPR) repeat protein
MNENPGREDQGRKNSEPRPDGVAPGHTGNLATTRSEGVALDTPAAKRIQPLTWNRRAERKHRQKNISKGVLLAAFLAGVIAAGALLFNFLTPEAPTGLEEKSASLPEAPRGPESAQRAEDQSPSLNQKAGEEGPPPVSPRTDGGMEARATKPVQPEAKTEDSSQVRGERRTKEEQFRSRMSGGLAAYHEKNYALARSELAKAKELKPDAPEVMETLAQVEAAVRLQSIGELKARAEEGEASEAWEKAYDAYVAALNLDQALQFAAQGRERTLERMHLDKRLEFYLQKPESLDSDDYLARAIELLARAERIEGKGPRLNRQVETLKGLVREAQKQVTVTLLSDNFTEVSVYRVGKLGRFFARELLLRPGRYTIVGTRDGYKDVRQEILVKPDTSPLQVNIACREKV